MSEADKNVTLSKEAKRACDLDDWEILELLANRQGRLRAKQALVTCKQMLRVAARAQPDQAVGLIMAANLVELYEEYLQPTGLLNKIPMTKLTAILMAPAPMVKPEAKPFWQAPVPAKPEAPAKVDLKVAPTVPLRKPYTRRTGAPNKGLGKSGMLQEMLRKVLKENGRVLLPEVKIPDGCTYNDLHNALTAMKKKGEIEHSGHGLYCAPVSVVESDA